MTYEYGGQTYKTKVEAQAAKTRDKGVDLPPLDFTCKGDDCKCPHHSA